MFTCVLYTVTVLHPQKLNELHSVKFEGTEWNTRILCLLEETGGGLITVRHTRTDK